MTELVIHRAGPIGPAAAVGVGLAEVRIEWGYEWRRIDGTTRVRTCVDEEDAREMAEQIGGRAVVLRREIRIGPWTTP